MSCYWTEFVKLKFNEKGIIQVMENITRKEA